MCKWLLLLGAALLLGGAALLACGDDDDDDHGGGSGDDDQSPGADDDQADDDLEPPYDPAQCEPFVEAWYDLCHLELTIGENALTAEQAVTSCEEFQYDFWICAITCFEDYGAACIDLYDCVSGCTAK
jgi:hypothetical protein